MIKTVATKCHILKLKCIKFDVDWGAYSAPTDPLAGSEGHFFHPLRAPGDVTTNQCRMKVGAIDAAALARPV